MSKKNSQTFRIHRNSSPKKSATPTGDPLYVVRVRVGKRLDVCRTPAPNAAAARRIVGSWYVRGTYTIESATFEGRKPHSKHGARRR